MYMRYSQKLMAQTSFHLVLSSSLVCPFMLFPPPLGGRLPSSVHRDASTHLPAHCKSLQSSLQYISLLIVTAGKGFFSLGAKLWKGMKINQILFAKGQNFACKSLALNWWFMEGRHEVIWSLNQILLAPRVSKVKASKWPSSKFFIWWLCWQA